MNLIENLATKRRLFKEESVFEISYIPKPILFREPELSLMSSIFYSVLDKPFSISRKVVIQGHVGVGKTLSMKVFFNNLEEAISIRGLNYRTFIINCRQLGTGHLILGTILASLGKKIKPRGVSAQELFDQLLETLKREKIYLIILLDELHYINEGKFPLIYNLSRISEFVRDGKQYSSIIGIVRDISLVRNLDASTKSTLQENIITFRNYSIDEIKSILTQRIQQGLKPKTISNDMVDFISNIVYQSGDIRKGLNIIKNAVLIAESKDNSTVQLEDVMNACDAESDSLSTKFIQDYDKSEIACLYALNRVLKRRNIHFAEVSDIMNEINSLPRRFNLKKMDISSIIFDLKKAEKAGFIKIDLEKDTGMKFATVSLENPGILKFDSLFQDVLLNRSPEKFE
jgi:cell division control protein 6